VSFKKIGQIAAREFAATASSKGFILGLLLTPTIIAAVAIVFPRVLNRGAQVRGEVAVIDRTGAVASELRASLAVERIVARRAELTRQAISQAPGALRQAAESRPETGAATSRSTEIALGGVPELQLIERAADADPQQEKTWLTDAPATPRRIALIVIQPNAVTPAPGGTTYGTYDLYVPPNTDDRVETEIYQAVREAIINARTTAQSLDRARIDAIVRVGRATSVTVTKSNERQTVAGFNMLLPAGFALVMFIGVMTGGQALLTSMVEEKSSRVIEVLLAAVSPMELLAGKLLAQLGVSFLALAFYLATGMVLLVSFAMIGLLNPWLLVYLFIFFVISYMVTGAMLVTVGSAVNDMREAQTMMMPIMLMIMFPWIFWLPISREPNSAFSVAISFIPPVNTFTMLLRMASNSPPPYWQVWTSIAIGVASVFAAIWFASKVFRIGLLMYGKPPNFATLVRWARAA
jgi:ABC-2 type transport system permease protein